MRTAMVTNLIFWMLLGGCSTARTDVWVLDRKELIEVKKGDAITAEFDGWFLSQRAVDRVMDANIKKEKLSGN